MTNMRTIQLLVWGELGIGTIALIPLWNLCSTFPILGHNVYVGAGRIYLLSQVLPVLSPRTQHLVPHPWSPSLDQNQGMRPQAQPQVWTRSLVFLLYFVYFVNYLDKNIILQY